MTRAVIVATGAANTASVQAALARCGVDVEIRDDPMTIERAPILVLPGVGSFQAGMRALESIGAAEIVATRVREGRPTLAVCLGMQMLFAASQESPGVRGLGVIDDEVRAFPNGARRPQLGWNQIEAEGPGVVGSGAAYFANSYRVERPPAGWRCAMSQHAGRFVAAIERGGVLACQFHPELSGAYGRGVIKAWLQTCSEEAPC